MNRKIDVNFIKTEFQKVHNYFIAQDYIKVIQKTKIFKCISVDGLPLISDIEDGINVWFGGTSLKIPSKYRNLKNNYVNMRGVFDLNKNTEKIFQIYPIISKKKNNKRK